MEFNYLSCMKQIEFHRRIHQKITARIEEIEMKKSGHKELLEFMLLMHPCKNFRYDDKGFWWEGREKGEEELGEMLCFFCLS